MKINLREWQNEFIPGLELESEHERELASLLSEKEIVKLIELKDGLSITTNSFVGSIYIGDIHLNIMPKIQGMDLVTLMNYAYQLKDLNMLNESSFNLQSFTFLDIFIYQLYMYSEELFNKGLHRDYIRNEEDLASPKGRLDFNKIAKNYHLKKATLPSQYFERDEDHLLNKVVLAGLKMCIFLANDRNLIVKLKQLCSYLSQSISDVTLTRQMIQKAGNQINRLTENYLPLLEMISILLENQGIKLEGDEKEVNIQGFFFDMNRFFELLVGRLLIDFAPKYMVKDQFSLHHMYTYTRNQNPKNRRSPTPRPDFAIVKSGKAVKLLDAKYRDLWEHSLPRDMLYQLSMYALSSDADKVATIIYPTLNEHATPQKININNPTTGEYMGAILLKSLNMNYLAKCLKNINRYGTELENYICALI